MAKTKNHLDRIKARIIGREGKVRKFIDDFNYIFGIIEPEEKIPDDVMVIVKMREESRAKKDWVASDRFRDQIKKLGYVLDDTKEGTIIKKI